MENTKLISRPILAKTLLWTWQQIPLHVANHSLCSLLNSTVNLVSFYIARVGFISFSLTIHDDNKVLIIKSKYCLIQLHWCCTAMHYATSISNQNSQFITSSQLSASCWTLFSFRLESFIHGSKISSSHKIWCWYLYPIRSYWYFSEIKDGGRRYLRFVWMSHGTTHEASFAARTSCKNFVMIDCVVFKLNFSRLSLKVLFTAP